MNKKELIIVGILTILIAFMDITGIPSAFFININILDIEPMYFNLMVNFVVLIIISKVIWTIGRGMYFGTIYKKTNNLWLPIILHFFINVCALPYCFSSISGYANLTLYIILPTYLLLGIYSMNIIKQEKME